MAACTWDPVQTDASVVLSMANLRAAVNITHFAQGTVAHNDAPRAFEIPYISNGGAPQVAMIGVGIKPATWVSYPGHYLDSWAFYEGDGKVYFNNTGSPVIGAFPTVGSVIGVVVDPIAGTLSFYDDGVLIGTYTDASLIGALVYPVWGCGSSSGNTVVGDLACIGLAHDYGVLEWDEVPSTAGGNFFALF